MCSSDLIPSRFSDERLIVFRVLKKFGIRPDEVKMVEMAPPDVAGALAAGAVDAFSMGEPFPSRSTVAVRELPLSARVEIEAWAFVA